MAAYDSRYNPFIRQLEKLRKSNPSLVARIENRADEIYENYSEDETYRKDRLTSRARAMEQAVKEYVDRSNTFREIDKRLGTTSEVADRELGMVRDTPNASAAMNRRKERLLGVAPNANLQMTPTNKTNRELAEDQAVSALEIYEDEQKRKSIEEQLNSLESAITPVFSSTSSMSGNKVVASVEEDEDTAIIDEEDEEDDVYGSLSLNQITKANPFYFTEGSPVNIVASDPTEESIVIEEDEEEVTDEDVDDIVSELNTIEGGRPSEASTSKPPTGMLATLSEYAPSILQAIGLGGASYFDNKAIGEANKRNRRSQARSNLINALSRGSGARASVSEPKTGVGSALFKSLAGLGKGVEARREAQETNEYRRKQQELAERRLGRDEARAEKLEKTNEAKALLKEYKDQTDVLMDVIQSAAKSGALNSKNFEQWLSSSPSVSKIYNGLPEQYQDLVRAGAAGAASNAEPGEATSLTNTVNILEDQYKKIDDPGTFYTGLKFDVSNFISEKFASRMLPFESVYENTADAFTLRLASAFNDGRPSNQDANAVSRIIPRLGMGEEANRERFAILRKLADFAKFAANKNFQLPGDSDGLLSSGILNPDGTINEDVLERYRKNIATESSPTTVQPSVNVTNVNSDTSWADGFVPKEE